MGLREEKKIAGVEKNVFFAGLTSFLTDTSTKMIYCIMPLFLLSIGATKTQLSLIEGVAESTAAFLKAFSGFWCDRVGRNKPFMLAGYAVTALISPLYALARTPLDVLMMRFIERVGKGVRTAPRDSLIAGSSQDLATGRNFGFHKAMDNCGALAGPLLAFFILSRAPSDYARVFLFSGIPAFLGVITILFFIREAGRCGTGSPSRIRLSDFTSGFYAFLGIVFVFSLGNSTDALLLVRAGETGVSSAMIPFAYLVFNGVSVICAVPLGMLSDRIGKERLILAGYLVYALVYFGFGAAQNRTAIFLLFALYGLYSAATDGVQKALVADLADQDRRGTALGLYHMLLGLALLPASFIAGLLYDRVSPGAPFYFGASMSVLAGVLMALFIACRGGKKGLRI
jgi:MFS family permease